MAEPTSAGTQRSGPGLFDSAKALLASLVAIAHNRLELLSTELQEEIARVALMLVWGAIGLFFVFLAIMFVALVPAGRPDAPRQLRPPFHVTHGPRGSGEEKGPKLTRTTRGLRCQSSLLHRSAAAAGGSGWR